MPKHYAKKHLTKTADIFDMINNQDDDTTSKDGTTPSRKDQRGEADTTSSTT